MGMNGPKRKAASWPARRPAFVLTPIIARGHTATMPLLALPFPLIDPVLIEIGPFAVRWYALAYIAGFMLGWWLAKRLVAQGALWSGGTAPFDKALIDDAIVWAALGGILGGRLAYVLIYNPAFFLDHPSQIFAVWSGGMAFHGGIIGLIAGLAIFAIRNRISALSLLDLAAVVAPIGIALGRLANFINQELWGRVTDVPWAVIFPRAGPDPRHPSQLYQAALEGVIVFVILFLVARSGGLKKPGQIAGLFGILYGTMRFVGEIFREPDPQLGFLLAGATMGQLLSLPIILAGIILVVRARA